jgi:hypothetical protein
MAYPRLFPIPRRITAGLFALLIWGVLTFTIHALTPNYTLGSDSFIFFHAGQTVFLNGGNPYSLELALENQIKIFQRPARPGEDQLGFAYPLYALFLIAPLLWLPFDWAQAAWAALLLLSLVIALPVSVKQARPAVVASIIFFYPVAFGLILGNYAVLLGAFLLLLYGVLERPAPGLSVQILAGVILAWLTIKPQFTWLYILFFLLAAFLRGQRSLLAGFGAGFTVLAAFSFAIRPIWMGEWIAAVQAYAGYNQTWPTLTVLLKDILPVETATILTWLLASVLLAGTAWIFWRWSHNQVENLLVFAWCGLVIYLLHPHGKSYEHITYLIPLVVWAASLPNMRSLSTRVFWFGSLGLSWLVFLISRQPGTPPGSTEWPVLFQAIWVGWLFLQKTSHKCLVDRNLI